MAKEKENDQEVVSSPPTGMQVIWREFKKDKVAMVSLFGLIIIIVGIFITSYLLNQEEIMRVSLRDMYAPPGPEHWLGADVGGRDIFGQLMIGARNSLLIAFVTLKLVALKISSLISLLFNFISTASCLTRSITPLGPY